SVEDLLPFSDERLVRAAASAHTPVVSAIGHEGDSPILDLAADVRASTPTDAAKLLVPDVSEEYAGIAEARVRMRNALGARLTQAGRELDAILARPPFARPQTMIDVRESDLSSLRLWLRNHMRRALDSSAAEQSNLLSRLRALSPQATLDRGYSILRDNAGIVTDAQNVSVGQNLHAILSSGSLELGVTTVHEGERHG
ncbi:exodeoxyribonuclease VII large subunit, partial [Ancrocorticia populi]